MIPLTHCGAAGRLQLRKVTVERGTMLATNGGSVELTGCSLLHLAGSHGDYVVGYGGGTIIADGKNVG